MLSLNEEVDTIATKKLSLQRSPENLQTPNATPLSRTAGAEPPTESPISLRRLSPVAAAALVACGGGSGGGSSVNIDGGGAAGGDVVVEETPSPAFTTASTDADAARFLLQAQFSASTSEIAAVRSQGYRAWLNAQMSKTSQTGWEWLNSRGYDQIDGTTRYYDNTYPGDYMIWKQLFTSSDAVRKRVALALSEIFVVSLSGLDFSWRSHAIAAWWDMLAANAFGNHRTLLEAVTLNPAMGWYLNTKGNMKENPSTGRLPDENYAREVMQLFTIGLVELNMDGTAKLDADGHKIDSYRQDDVSNLARVFTGYDWDRTGNVNTLEPLQNRTIGNTLFARLPMTSDPTKHLPSSTTSKHSALAVSFLGTDIEAGADPTVALQRALDTLFNHPNTPPFFCKQMIQRLVTSNPSAAYVGRVSAAFVNNGNGVRGDLKAVLRAILLDDEARDPARVSNPNFGKLREPMLRFVQWGRTFGLNSARGSWKIGDQGNPASALGQSALRSGSVFNFFRPGYVPPQTAMAMDGLVAPEFQLVNESSVGGYLNRMQGVIRNGLYVNAPDVPQSASNTNNGYDLKATYTEELKLVFDPVALVNRLNLLLCAGALSESTRTTIVNAISTINVTSTSTDDLKLNRVCAAVLLVMSSAEYLIQK